jgi:hypothetical protein
VVESVLAVEYDDRPSDLKGTKREWNRSCGNCFGDCGVSSWVACFLGCIVPCLPSGELDPHSMPFASEPYFLRILDFS